MSLKKIGNKIGIRERVIMYSGCYESFKIKVFIEIWEDEEGNKYEVERGKATLIKD